MSDSELLQHAITQLVAWKQWAKDHPIADGQCVNNPCFTCDDLPGGIDGMCYRCGAILADPFANGENMLICAACADHCIANEGWPDTMIGEPLA